VLVIAVVALVTGTTALVLTISRGSAEFGLVRHDTGSSDGYTLYGPLNTSDTFLVDMNGEVVHHWPNTARPGNSAYLLPNGQLLRTEKSTRPEFKLGRGRGGVIEEVDPDGTVAWRLEFVSDEHLQHHDIEPLPNGNILLLAWERHSNDEAIAVGRAPELLRSHTFWSEMVVEIDPSTNAVVWQWRVWDHLVQDRDPNKPSYGSVADEPGRLDVNFPGGPRDWLHANSVAYNAELDQVMISLRRLSEIWIVDHATTTEAARGSAGDLLFRWGNPAVYRRGDASDQQLFGQHDAEWIPAGHSGAGRILVFNNGSEETRPYSSVDEIDPTFLAGRYELGPDGTFLPARSTRVHPRRAEDRWLSSALSGAQRLPNGNTLIVDGPAGRLFEVTPAGESVWEYVNPFYERGRRRGTSPRGDPVLPWRVFNAEHYPPDYPGLRRLLD
jgi:hypothetical protein